MTEERLPDWMILLGEGPDYSEMTQAAISAPYSNLSFKGKYRGEEISLGVVPSLIVQNQTNRDLWMITGRVFPMNEEFSGFWFASGEGYLVLAGTGGITHITTEDHLKEPQLQPGTG